MRISLRRAGRAGVLTAALILIAHVVSVPAAAEPANDLTIVNSASFQGGRTGNDATDAVSRGGFLTVYTDRPVTGEHQTFDFPWPDTTPQGLYIETDSCDGFSGGIRRLPISFAGPNGFGGSQVNFYYSNDYGTEPDSFPHCFGAGYDRITVHPAGGYGAEFSRSVLTMFARPGLFMNGNAPAGTHLHASTGATTSFTDCNNNPNACPVATNGKPNYLLLYTTGGEYYSCPTEMQQCNDPDRVTFTLSAVNGSSTGPPVEQDLEFYGYAEFLGQEQANVKLRSDLAPGTYRLNVNITSELSPKHQDLLVRLGPPS
jgi:uncharacterized protein (TIGR03437 family)